MKASRQVPNPHGLVTDPYVWKPDLHVWIAGFKWPDLKVKSWPMVYIEVEGEVWMDLSHILSCLAWWYSTN